MTGDYRGRHVLVVGLGRSGLAAIDFLLARGATIRANDEKPKAELSPEALRLESRGVELVSGSHPVTLAEDVDLVVVSPGVRLELPMLVAAARRGAPLWSELELGFREVRGTTLAVTGTKGKSTTTTLLAEMLRVSGREVKLAGNIGSPLVAEVDGSSEKTVFVLEVSSFQLAAIQSFRPHIAVLLDVSPDHLDWHATFSNYVRAKERLFENQRESDWAVVFGGNPLTVDMAKKSRSRKLYFDLDCLGDLYPHLHLDGPWIVRHEDGAIKSLASLEEFQLPGRHNRLDAMAASAAAALLGVTGENLSEVFAHFEGLPHALEKVADIGGVLFYNDSKATNAQAVRAALDSFDSDILLILGGRLKGGDFRTLMAPVSKKVKQVLAIGESQDEVALALGETVSVQRCRDLESAVREAHRHAAPGDVVLLSPGAASFDMFRDYRERGERFREIVHRLEAE